MNIKHLFGWGERLVQTDVRKPEPAKEIIVDGVRYTRA